MPQKAVSKGQPFVINTVVVTSLESCLKKIKIYLCNQKVSDIFVTERFHIAYFMRRDVFQAIADPTRREIIGLIAHQSLNLNAIADNFEISRPAVSKHIKILTQCGLITIKQEGRDRFCEANFGKLNEVSSWVEQYRRFWTSKLDALGDFLDKETKDNQ